MKQLNSHIVNELDDATLKKQMQVGQTVQKINTLMDVAEGLLKNGMEFRNLIYLFK